MNRAERGLVLPRAIVVLICFLPLGCSKSGSSAYPVHGEVFFNGQPATGAAVHFHPLDDPDRSAAYAIVDEDGSFQMSTFGTNDGAEPGNYAVTINWRKEEKIDGEIVASDDLLGDRYSKAASSGLKVTVAEEENVIPRYDLKD